MPGVNKWNSKKLSQFSADISGIRIMAVNDVRKPSNIFNMLDAFINKLFKMIPKQFFTDIFTASASYPYDAEFIIYFFFRNRIII